jgi:ATP/maltotriose-dependent transcriptional regulator MalT
VVGILGYLAFFFWNESQREALGEEFTACQDEAARRAFAGRHAGEPLAAVALTDVADDLKRAGKFADAAKAYDEARRLAGLAGNTPAVAALAARARLYAALCRLETGDAGATKALAEVADDVSAAETLRGFAMLTLANVAVAKGDTAEATKWLNAMDKKLRANHVWKADKEMLVRSEPSLIAPVAPAGK